MRVYLLWGAEEVKCARSCEVIKGRDHVAVLFRGMEKEDEFPARLYKDRLYVPDLAELLRLSKKAKVKGVHAVLQEGEVYIPELDEEVLPHIRPLLLSPHRVKSALLKAGEREFFLMNSKFYIDRRSSLFPLLQLIFTPLDEFALT